MYPTSVWCTEQSACTKLLSELKALHAKFEKHRKLKSGSSSTSRTRGYLSPGPRGRGYSSSGPRILHTRP
jgi:hypothetical protein